MNAGFPRDPALSLWASTARPTQDFAPLEGERRADVVVVGGGYTGLSAAHHLAKAGQSVIVLEASSVGWGASGRNGGVVGSKFRLSYTSIAAAHGVAMARRMYAIGHEAVDGVQELIETLGIEDAAFRLCGQVKAAHNATAFKAARDEAEWLRDVMGDRGVAVLDREEVRAETGSDAFVGGTRTVASGGLHPLNYVRGLASGAASAGASIHEASPVLDLRPEGQGVLATTPCGRVVARRAILATNAYADLTKASAPLHKRLVPFRSAIIATAPLSANLSASVMPSRRIYGETRRMMRWFRMVDDRVVFGGRGAFGRDDREWAFRSLRRGMVGLFPMLAEQPIAFRWSGLVAMTLDAIPHVGRLDDRVLFAHGYNGAGVALSSLMGRYLARFAAGDRPDMALLDAAGSRPVPLYALREPAVRLVTGWYQVLDAIGR